MGRTAFLILAHHRPEQLARLVDRLRSPMSDIFIHVDRKAAAPPFHAVVDGARFLPDARRVAVHWGGFSMVRATFELIRFALAEAPEAERFVLLSGAHYPTRPVREILAALAGDAEHIRIDRVLDPEGEGWFDRCANRLYLGDNALLNPRTGRYRPSQLARRLEALAPRRRHGLAVHYGPQWWALTRPTLEEALAAVEAQPRRLASFRFARTPDEMVFQTLLKASSHAERIVQDATTGPEAWHPALAGVTYVAFDALDADEPRILTLADLPDIRASGALFARKMDPDVSAPLMDALDAGSEAARAA
ncbi:MAG: beta-1,6-N-acetylglucosaminyltransferase [Phenylobacterium sp.]|uniref:beta-1,6-N-acetylglucosaminyltransferase n=1 Tax=Phenylobacterium sp. TaxID=1871053 RepID=UPI003919194C